MQLVKLVLDLAGRAMMKTDIPLQDLIAQDWAEQLSHALAVKLRWRRERFKETLGLEGWDPVQVIWEPSRQHLAFVAHPVPPDAMLAPELVAFFTGDPQSDWRTAIALCDVAHGTAPGYHQAYAPTFPDSYALFRGMRQCERPLIVVVSQIPAQARTWELGRTEWAMGAAYFREIAKVL